MTNQIKFCILISALFLFACSKSKKDKSETKVDIRINNDTNVSQSPLASKRLSDIKKVINSEIPVLTLEGLDQNATLAQSIVLQNKVVQLTFKDTSTKNNYLSEVITISEASVADLPKETYLNNKFKVVIYNYGLNLTTIAFVDIQTKQLIKIDSYKLMQPELNETLSKLATNIAIHSKEVREALGYKPGEEDAIMSATKTALNRTKCERSLHLCAAPTFVKGEKALWAIVDLTEMRLVGVRWTKVGDSGPGKRVTEKSLRIDKVMECNCRKKTHLKKGNWEMDYILTSSDGLEVTDVKYKNKPVLLSAKLVDFHVIYSNTDGFGYSDAVGCPQFSSAAVTAVDEAKIFPIPAENQKGFMLQQTFLSEQWPKPCNYSYIQNFEFYDDGSFRIGVGSLGRGCGNDGTYRPVTRIVFANQNQEFQHFNQNNWQTWNTEKWELQNELSTYFENKYLYRLNFGDGSSYFVEPGTGQFKNNRGDFAYTYITRHHPELSEGDTDLPTIGPCCNTNFEQGPEKFIDKNPEDIKNKPLVMWYVSQLKNDGRAGNEYCWAESYLDNGIYKTRVFPCISGPKFIPVNQ
jgi:Cu2+-containing amine oxidase